MNTKNRLMSHFTFKKNPQLSLLTIAFYSFFSFGVQANELPGRDKKNDAVQLSKASKNTPKENLSKTEITVHKLSEDLAIDSNPILLTEKFVPHRSLGLYSLEIKRNINAQGYVISIFDQRGYDLQSLTVESSVSVDSFLSIVDLDGDGYKDLLVLSGYSPGPFPNTLLYRFNPDSRRFDTDESFPGGYATPTRTVGCIYIHERKPGGSAHYYYEFTEWCLSTEKKWIAGTSCDQLTQSTCYERIENYERQWWKKHGTLR